MTDAISDQTLEDFRGDVILVHPSLLHAASVNAGRAPRFVLSGAVDFDTMWPNAVPS